MLKKILLAIAVAIPALVSAQTVKIGIIDTEAIITTIPDAKAADNELAEVSKKFEAEFGKLQAEFNNKVEEYNKLSQDELSPIKERKARDIEDTRARIEEFRESAAQALQKKQAELFAPIQQKIMNAIESVGKEGNFTIIQEKTQLLYFAAPAEDITPLVKKKLGI